MNLPQFLKEVDRIASSMPQEELTSFIHEIARVLPEVKRADFLNRLNEIHGLQDDGQAADCRKEDGISQRFEGLKEKLKSIEDGELCLVGFLNEEYDDWYNSSADEFLYEDPKGVLDAIEDACGFLHQCVDCGEYGAGYEIAQILVGLNIMVGGEYLDYTDEPINIDDLGYYHLGTLDYRQLVVDALYVAYCANVLADRADALYRMLENSGRNDITMEMVMQNGEELPEIDSFLKLWIDYLGRMTSANAERLIEEALELTNDQEQLLENARKYCAQHPALYEQFIRNNMQKDGVDLLEVGKEALAAIDCKYIVRSRVALLISTVALRQGRQPEAENCWLEAFRSDTRIVNYLRLFKECTDFSKVREEIQNICHLVNNPDDQSPEIYRTNGELQENRTSTTTAYMLAFFEGEFRYVKEHAMASGRSLGWSSTFMKCGLAAFLLFLLEDDTLQQGCRKMCGRVVNDIGFDAAEYQKGTLRTLDDSSENWFWKCFCDWKSRVSVSGEEKKMYLQWVEGLIAKRTEGIMEGNYRNYYGECAGYIAALREVKESMGERNGKQKILSEYKALYSRRSAFHRELREFGMKDQKNKRI